MIYIKKFIDRVSALDNKPGKDLIMPAVEAKMLRDEIARLMSDKIEAALGQPRTATQQTGEVTIRGGSFK
jgi:hypothetical protein